MFYKTILVYLDAAARKETHVKVAATLAVRADAHLIGVAATGIPHLPQGPAALDRFETLAQALGVLSCEKRLIDADAAVALSRQGLYADLIVLAQGGAGDGSLAGAVDFPVYVVLNAACPVLIVPGTDPRARLCDRVLVAWNGSRAAARAVRNALPLLQEATRVHVAVIDTATSGVQMDGETRTDLLAFLARHGIRADIIGRSAQDDAGYSLLSLAAELDSNMLVTGCVAHPHTRSLRLGGATGIILRSATIPVLMSH